MPIIKSAKKRVKVSAKARARNLRTKRDMREALKAYAAALAGGKSADIAKAQSSAASALDTAVKKDVIHKNKAARFKSRLAKQAKAAGVKPAKAAVKKTAPKKAAAKKPIRQAQGKTAAKKPTAKKTTAKK